VIPGDAFGDDTPNDIRIQDASTAHHALILDSFLHEYRTTRMANGTPPAVLLAKMRALLEAPTWRALVATPDGDEILGFLVYRDATTAAWLQVKRIYRGRGVARALTKAAGLNEIFLDVAFMPDRRLRNGPNCRFRPYLPDVAALDTEILEMVG
jgi:GNAT superfamily N-acetyltransferase